MGRDRWIGARDARAGERAWIARTRVIASDAGAWRAFGGHDTARVGARARASTSFRFAR